MKLTSYYINFICSINKFSRLISVPERSCKERKAGKHQPVQGLSSPECCIQSPSPGNTPSSHLKHEPAISGQLEKTPSCHRVFLFNSLDISQSHLNIPPPPKEEVSAIPRDKHSPLCSEAANTPWQHFGDELHNKGLTAAAVSNSLKPNPTF